jgi:hypothetical protein
MLGRFDIDSVVTPWGLAGGGPAATPFLCFAKERKQRKATAGKLPFGFASKYAVKREMKQTRLRLRQVSFLIRFTAYFDASFQAQFVRRDYFITPLGYLWSFNVDYFEVATCIAYLRRCKVFLLVLRLSHGSPLWKF